MSKPIHLRDCPMCHKKPTQDNGPMMTAQTGIDLETGEEFGALGYSVTCCNCGCEVSGEYLAETALLWNGAQS